MVATPTEQPATTAQATVVRDFVSHMGLKAVTFYSSAVEASPELVKSQLSQLETLVTPYREPVLTKWNAHGDPLLSVLDQTVASQIVPRAKAVEQGVQACVTKSEDYLKSSVQLAHDKVNATEQFVGDHVVTPLKPYAEAVTDAAKRNKEFVETCTRDTIEGLLVRADKAVDFVLPELPTPESSPSPSESSECSKPDPARLTRKVASRMYSHATEIYAHSTERARQIVHIDLIAYAKAATGTDEAKLAKVFDSTVARLPTPETTQKVSNAVVASCPEKLRPLAVRGAAFVTPVADLSFSTLSSFVFFLRSFAVTPVSEIKECESPQEPAVQVAEKKDTAPDPAKVDESAAPLEDSGVNVPTETPIVEAATAAKDLATATAEQLLPTKAEKKSRKKGKVM